MTWKKGESGNPNGRPKKGLAWADVLREIADEEVKGKDEKMTKMDAIARMVFKKAFEGDLGAINILMDRIDGKPRQIIEANMKQVNVLIDGKDAKRLT